MFIGVAEHDYKLSYAMQGNTQLLRMFISTYNQLAAFLLSKIARNSTPNLSNSTSEKLVAHSSKTEFK